MNIVDAYMRVSARAEALVQSIPEDRFNYATPCSEWDVKALCNHIYAGEIVVSTRIQRAPLPDPKSSEDRLGDDPKGKISAAFDELRDLLSKPDALDQTVLTSRAGVTYERDLEGLVSRRIADLVVHTWDLQKALGRSTADSDPELVAWTLEHFRARLEGYDRNAMPIIGSVALAKPLPEGANDADRLAAFMGRNVEFTPGVFHASEGLALRRRSRSQILLAASVLSVAAAVLAGCSSSSSTAAHSATNTAGGSQPPAGGQVGDVLTIAGPSAIRVFDPSLALSTDRYAIQLAYEPLLVHATDGSYQPGLATSWKYVGPGNRKFVLELRPGVKFSDGSALTAAGVVAYFHYVATSAGPQASLFAGDTFAATAPLEVTIQAAKPNPDLEYNLSQDTNGGSVISPDALKNPSSLKLATAGAGEYVLDASATVTGSRYTFVPNPNYYDKGAIHWKKVVYQVIASPQSTLAAMRSGQVNLAIGDESTMASAKQAGLRITQALASIATINLADRQGTLVPALAQVKVRQALNYAVDRATIQKALYPNLGSPASQMALPGNYGDDPSLDDSYAYDVSRAKSLLTRAGYPDGFSLDLYTTDAGGLSNLAQAVAQQWAKIGVKATVKDIPNPQAFLQAALGGQAAVYTTNYNAQPVATAGKYLYLPPAVANPFHTADSTLERLYNQDLQASGSAKEVLDQKIVAYLNQQAWFVPVVGQEDFYYATKNITGTQVSAGQPLLWIYDVAPAA
jgi:peptide/nickel transport system substrate-binding protein